MHKEPSAELRESYITTTIPLGEGIQFKGGLFVTPLGTEILLNPGSYNDQISRSFAFNYAIPIRHLGTLFTYPALKTLSVSGGLVTGWDDPRDNNGAPSFLGGVNFTPSDTFGLASNIIFGPEQTHNTGRTTCHLEQRRHDQADGSAHSLAGVHVWYGEKRIDTDGH